MEKTFRNSPITLKLPNINYSTGEVLIKIKNTLSSLIGINIYGLTIIDKLNNKSVLENVNLKIYICHTNKEIAFRLLLDSNIKRILKRDARVQISLLIGSATSRQATQLITVSYFIDPSHKLCLSEVKIQDPYEKEQLHWNKCSVEFPPIEPNPPVPPEPKPPQHDNEWIEALNTEINFLRNGNGKKFKATDGLLITDEKGLYIYQFDLENELHLSDNSPVKVYSEGIAYEGEVLICEEFSIIIILRRNIGKKLPIVYISVEPWKLLIALRDRLSDFYNKSINSPIGRLLIEDGPLLAHKNQGIDNILIGQSQAIKKGTTEPITIIWGPPGTGKTTTMSKIALKHALNKKSVLIVSHSNVSVDGVIKKIAAMAMEKNHKDLLLRGKILRYGYVRDEELSKNDYATSFNYVLLSDKDLAAKRKTLEDQRKQLRDKKDEKSLKDLSVVQKKLQELHMKVHYKEGQVTSNALIVATTMSKLIVDSIFKDKKYDVVMFDEASMAYIPQVFASATFAKNHFICVGDFAQLSPIVQSSHNDILKKDIFHYLNIRAENDIQNHPWLVMLNVQYRMHADISQFINRYSYRGKLSDNAEVKKARIEECNISPFPGSALTLLDLKGTYCSSDKTGDNSRFNILSAAIAFVTAVKTERDKQFYNGIGIISPYAAQTKLIRAMLLDYKKDHSSSISCSTVHQFQGSEKDVIVFDAVESFPGKKPGFLMSKNDNRSLDRLINVAVSRARVKLIVPCNTAFWDKFNSENTNMFQKLVNHIEAKNKVISGEELIAHLMESTKVGNLKVYRNSLDYIENFKKDCQRANKRIIVTIPQGNLDNPSEDGILDILKEVSKNGIEVSVLAKNKDTLPHGWNGFSSQWNKVTFPLVIIDEKIVWYGLPKSDAKFFFKGGSFLTKNWFAFRFYGNHTATLIKSICGLTTVTGTSENSGSFSSYASKKLKCPICHESMILRKKNAYYMYCKSCKKIQLISDIFVNNYLDSKDVRCPEHGTMLEARIGHSGLYVSCKSGDGHRVKLEYI